MINFLRIKEDKRLFNALKTGFSSISIKLISVILSMVTVPMTLSYLGKERYGIWLTISSTLAFISFADFGLGNNLVNSISKAHANNNSYFAKIEISNSFFLMCIISIFISVFFMILWYNNSFIQIGNRLNEEVINTLILVFSLVIFGLPLAISQRIFEGYQEGYTYQIFLLVNTILGFLLIVFFIRLRLGMPYLAFAFLTPTVFANLTSSFYLFFVSKPGLKPNFRLFNFPSSLKGIKSGMIFFLLQILGFLNLSADNFLISLFDRISNVPTFDIVKRLFSVFFLLSYFLTPLWPAFAEAIEKKDFAWAEKIFYKLFKYSLIATSITTLLILIFSKIIFHLWINNDFNPSWILLVSFYFFTLVSNVGGVMSSLFSSSNFISKQLLYVGVATVTTIILKIIFLKYLDFNYLMWANVIAFSIFFIYPSIKLANQYFKVYKSKL